MLCITSQCLSISNYGQKYLYKTTSDVRKYLVNIIQLKICLDSTSFLINPNSEHIVMECFDATINDQFIFPSIEKECKLIE